jgi:aryl-alcohol dehydrogenase-like predicted oxidoreductase
MRGLDDLISRGIVHYIGISDTPAWIVSRCNTMAELRGWNKFAALQIEYSLLQRTPERDLIPMANALDLAITPWAPLAGGALTGKYLLNQPGRVKEESPRRNERANSIASVVMKIAEEKGSTPARVALNWIRQQKGIQIPIIGARIPEQLKDSLLCIGEELNPQEIQRLNAVSAIELGFPHDFLQTEGVKDVLFGGTFEQVDNHRR